MIVSAVPTVGRLRGRGRDGHRPRGILGIVLTIVFGLSGAQAASAAGTVTVEDGRDQVALTWRGDETIQVGISKSRGLIGGPVSVRVDDRRLTFDGFYARFNGQESGFTVITRKR